MQTTWAFGLQTAPSLEVSSLEQLIARGISWVPSWQSIGEVELDLFGRPLVHACGTAPPIYALGPVLGNFAKGATDAELWEFVRVMQAGTAAEQRAAIDIAVEKALDSVPASTMSSAF